MPSWKLRRAPPARVIDVGAARAAGFNIKHDDDLTIIEGIGPRIDELLQQNGVVSFAQLARLGVPEILEILERGGPHFQLANPGIVGAAGGARIGEPLGRAQAVAGGTDQRSSIRQYLMRRGARR